MSSHTHIVQKLVKYFTDNPQFKTAFEQSFALAYATGLPEFKDFNIHSVDDYLRYMDKYVHWVPTEDISGKNVYNHICLFYFILDMPPVRDHQSPIAPTSQNPWLWLSEWLIEYAKEMGTWMSTAKSISQETIDTVAASPAYRDTPETDFFEQYPRPAGGWNTFNDFFARHINPSFRPIADPEDPSVIVSPADCSFDGTWPINEKTVDVTTFDVKGVPWSISQLLNDKAYGTDYGSRFAGGLFTHSFLNTTDYHRQHAPVGGRVLEAKVIEGLCYLEVVLKQVDDDTAKSGHRMGLGMHRRIIHKYQDPKVIPHHKAVSGVAPDAPDTPGYQFIQARGLILLETAIGLVAVLPIGMAQVSSVKLAVKKGDIVKKGQEISHFEFGGSDIVMVFQKSAQVKLDQEINVHYKFGSRIGTGQRLPLLDE